jgi:hypothetical protein
VLLGGEGGTGGDRYARMTMRGQRGQAGPAGNSGGIAEQAHGQTAPRPAEVADGECLDARCFWNSASRSSVISSAWVIT